MRSGKDIVNADGLSRFSLTENITKDRILIIIIVACAMPISFLGKLFDSLKNIKEALKKALGNFISAHELGTKINRHITYPP